ncbi:MAG: DUF4197 family protein [Opitutaceae bacterium]|nr:DUF4197 family protein [Opitutaceae bacterium]
MKITLKTLLAVSLLATLSASGASFFDLFKRKPAAAPSPLSALSQDQMVGGLKEALGHGVQKAIASLGQEDGFLKDLNVKIPMPESLQKAENGLTPISELGSLSRHADNSDMMRECGDTFE